MTPKTSTTPAAKTPATAAAPAAPSPAATPPTSPAGPSHDPQRIVAELKAKLSARSRHVCLFLGAGASRCAGLPDLKGLEGKVLADLSPAHKAQLTKLLVDRNLETALSRLRRIKSLVSDGESFDGFDKAGASALDQEICQKIVGAVSNPTGSTEPFIRLASWMSKSDYHLPIEVFTVNYDLLVETGLEYIAAPFFDGFVGTIRAQFRADLVEDSSRSSTTRLPPSFVRLWKLHGSVNWILETTGSHTRILRTAIPTAATPVAIFPSEEKYDDSRRVPFVVLMDRFRRALAEPETILLIAGYSFSDEHLNEIIFNAVQRHPRSEVVAFCYGDAPKCLLDESLRTKNMTVLAAKQAVVGGVALPWTADRDVPGICKAGAFELGDFAKLTTFLAIDRIGDA